MTCPFDAKAPAAGDIVSRLKKLSSAEEFFETLGLRYRPEQLESARLHILRRMGEYLAGDDLEGLPDTIAAARARAWLKRAYDDFTVSTPIRERVFRVLKDHDPKRPVRPGQPFVALGDVRVSVETD
jgi:hypothetical protein